MTTGRVLQTIGGACQILGVGLVYVEISQAEHALRLRSWLRRLLDDADRRFSAITRQFRRRRPQRVELKGAVDFAAALDAARILVIPAEGGSVEERLDGHRQLLDQLRRDAEEIRGALEQARGDQRAALADLETRMRSEIELVLRLVTELGGSSLGVRAIGAILILLGSALIIWGVWA